MVLKSAFVNFFRPTELAHIEGVTTIFLYHASDNRNRRSEPVKTMLDLFTITNKYELKITDYSKAGRAMCTAYSTVTSKM